MSKNTDNTLVALLIAAGIGAAIGILFAPDKGAKTREKLREGFDDAKNDLQDKLEIAGEELLDKFSNSKIDLEQTFEEVVSSLSYKTEDVISFLEEKLAELKKENAKLQQ
jgi:gas vesicle protein